MELCTSYGLKSNPGMKLKNLIEEAGIEFIKYTNETKKSSELPDYEGHRLSLITDQLVISQEYTADSTHKISILLAGSAGEGTQSAAEFLARTAMLSGLHVTRKSHVPVTVGVGFSASEVIISKEPIYYTGSSKPDYILITSKDGLEYAMPRLTDGYKSIVYLDATLQTPETASEIHIIPMREKVGARNAALLSVFKLVTDSRMFSMESMISAYSQHKLAAKLPIDTFLDQLN